MDNQLNHFFFLSSGDERKVGASKKVGGGGGGVSYSMSNQLLNLNQPQPSMN